MCCIDRLHRTLTRDEGDVWLFAAWGKALRINRARHMMQCDAGMTLTAIRHNCLAAAQYIGDAVIGEAGATEGTNGGIKMILTIDDFTLRPVGDHA